MIAGIPIDLCFLASVFLIWTMLVYQFVLAFAGYLYSRESAREKAALDRKHLTLPPLSILILGEMKQATVVHESPYDPDNVDLRA